MGIKNPPTFITRKNHPSYHKTALPLERRGNISLNFNDKAFMHLGGSGAKLNIKNEFCTMLVADFVKISMETLKLLSKYGVKTDDFKYIDLFADFQSLTSDGNKVSYAVVMLSNKYKISESSVYRILKRFKAIVKI